ncbi:hypothetical protein ACFFNY_10660 [Paenibacillus hodogayensis]|uniref:Uncharacterized protein n=1 Tax=Paenibacillus hodogayensis TaxID=279208 RepID=A0ABV5VVI1_9BACL
MINYAWNCDFKVGDSRRGAQTCRFAAFSGNSGKLDGIGTKNQLIVGYSLRERPSDTRCFKPEANDIVPFKSAKNAAFSFYGIKFMSKGRS